MIFFIYIYTREETDGKLADKKTKQVSYDVTYAIGKLRAWNTKYKKPHPHKSIGIAECTSKISKLTPRAQIMNNDNDKKKKKSHQIACQNYNTVLKGGNLLEVNII